jgi:hypothetical protein
MKIVATFLVTQMCKEADGKYCEEKKVKKLRRVLMAIIKHLYLLAREAVQFGINLLTFRRNILPPFQTCPLFLLLVSFGLLFGPEDEGNTFLRNIYKLLPDYTSSQPRSQCSS